VELTVYLESLSVDARRELASRCGTSLEYLRQIAAGIRTPKVQLAIAISRESDGAVSCESLLPNVDWNYLRKLPQREQAA